MPEVYLASAALKEESFDGLRTIEEAKKNGFSGVQLFLDKKYHETEYLEEIFDKLHNSNLGLVLHLPNEVEEKDKEIAMMFSKEFPNCKLLIHYLPAVQLPDIDGVIAGWENSIIGDFNDEQISHIEKVKKRVKDDDSFFVFDFGRMMYLEESELRKNEAFNYIKDQISRLDPRKDIIHLTDKKGWTITFRDGACVLGEGICGDLLEELFNYQGIIVFEYENLQMAISSLEVIKTAKSEGL
jgi:hypothetical protein